MNGQCRCAHLAAFLRQALAFALLVATAPLLHGQETEARIKTLEERIEKLEAKLEQLLRARAEERPEAPGPRFQGRTLPAWLAELADRDGDVRRKAAEALRKSGKDALQPLREALGASDWFLRREVVDLLGSSEFVVEAAGDLIKALGDSNEGVRGTAARELGHLAGDQPPTEVLKTARTNALGALKPLFTDASEEVQLQAAASVARLGTEVDLSSIPTPLLVRLAGGPPGRRALSSADTAATLAIGRTLAARGGESGPLAVPLLKPLLGDRATRVEAAEILAKLGPAARVALEDLQEALHDAEEVLDSARELAARGPAIKARKKSSVRIVTEEEAAQAAEQARRLQAAIDRIEGR